MSDNEARQLGIILTVITVLLAALSIVSSIYFYAPSDPGDVSGAKVPVGVTSVN